MLCVYRYIMILSYKNRKTKQTLIIILILSISFIYVGRIPLSYTLNDKNVFIDPLIKIDHKKTLSKIYENKTKRSLSYSYPSNFPKKYPVLVCSSQKINDSIPLFISKECYWYSKSLTYTEIEKLSKKDIIKSIIFNQPKKLMLSYAIPFAFGNRTYINGFPHNILTNNNKQLTGSNVRISIIDTGINDTNPWFDDAKIIYKASIHYFQSNNTCIFNTSQTSYFDYNGHGTHVTSIAHSIAPSSEIITLKPSNFRDDEIICAIEKALELNSSIISMSLGGIYYLSDCSNTYDMLCSYIDSLVSSNPEIIFTVAAGNEGYWPWHYGNYNKQSSVSIDYLNYPSALSYCGNINRLSFNIIWYDVSKRINSVEVINKSNNVLLGEVFYDALSSSYLVYTYNISYLGGGFDCSSNQCFLSLHYSTPYDVKIRINSSSLEWDFYDLLYFKDGCYRRYPPKYISPSNNNRTITSPGISSNVLTIGSVASHIYDPSITLSNVGDISYFSSRGNVKINSSDEILKPDLVAPGEQILAANNTGINATFSGTSMATPFMAGIVALIKQVLPTLTINELKQNLSSISLLNVYNLANFYRNEKGNGLINISSLLYALPKLEIASVKNIEIYSETNTSYSIINFSVKGVFRAKINLTKYYPNKNYILNLSINTSTIRTADNYTLNHTLEGEFLNSPLNISIKIIAYSNLSSISLRNYTIINSTHGNITMEITNKGFNAECNLSFKNITHKVWINKTSNITKVFEIDIKPIITINLSINCPNNLGLKNTTLEIYGINVSIKEKVYLLDNITINITPLVNISDGIKYYVVINNEIAKFVNYTNETQTINISTLDIYKNNTETYPLLITLETINDNIILIEKNITILLPLNISIYLENTLENTLLGLNSTLNILFNNFINKTFNISIKFNSTQKNIIVK